MTASKTKDAQLAIRPSAEAVVAQFVDMVATIPDWVDDGGLAMAADIFQAKSAADLDARWRNVAEDRMVGVPVEVDHLEKAPSTIEDAALPFYLVVYGTDMRTGERIRFTTSSLAVSAQLAQAWVADWLPLPVRLTVGDKTAKGFKPKHLEILKGEK